MFSIIISALGDLEGVRVLDLYAGSGALGLEALSRGGQEAVFIEQDRECARLIEVNAEALGLVDRCRVLPLRVKQGLSQLEGEEQRFGLVLADPPYADPLDPLLDRLGVSPVLDLGTLLVVEHGRKNLPPEAAGAHRLVSRRAYGDSMLSVYRAEQTTDA